MVNLFFTNIAYASVDSVIHSVNELIINPLIVFLFALALVYFLFGVFTFISNQENEEKKTSGKKHMIWGIIGITIMLAVWTLLHIILDTFNITGIKPEQGTVILNKYNPVYPAVGTKTP